ncbi:hypothetical protein GZOEXZXM_CDS0036 [Salmonella phage SeKF_64]|uniref:Uncharacterized protein n=5 Tax=Caudoviricetes TaxID=2731619 RepID=A0AAU8GIB4_9CAUD|nr:hypothetical protein SeF6a_167 [Salmonella phage SeF6a]
MEFQDRPIRRLKRLRPLFHFQHWVYNGPVPHERNLTEDIPNAIYDQT